MRASRACNRSEDYRSKRAARMGKRGDVFIRVISYLYWDSYCGYFGEIVLQRGALIYERQSRPFRVTSGTEITTAGNGSYNRHSECLNKVRSSVIVYATPSRIRPSFDHRRFFATKILRDDLQSINLRTNRKLFPFLYRSSIVVDRYVYISIWPFSSFNYCCSNFIEFIASKGKEWKAKFSILSPIIRIYTAARLSRNSVEEIEFTKEGTGEWKKGRGIISLGNA